jgi:hypothetical protein
LAVRLADAVAALVAGFFVTPGLAAGEAAGVFLTVAAVVDGLAKALFRAGVVVDPPPQASPTVARVAAKVRIFRMVK